MRGRVVRVAIVVSDGLASRGGIGRVMSYLVRALRREAPDIRVTAYRARLASKGPWRHPTAPLALARFAFGCWRGADVVHINVAPRGSTWRKALFERTAHLLGKPVILHLHGSGYDDFYASLDPTRQARVRALFGRVACVVALSGYWQRFVVETLGVPGDRVVAIANGVPAAAPAVVKVPADLPVIAFLGIVGERKGVDVLLDALSRLGDRPWRAVIGGNGEVERALGQAAALGIGDRIEFLGWVDEAQVDTVLRAADLFVLPSRAENQPVSILEAMARATPVVASRIGAIPDQVIDGDTGLLVTPGDADDLAAAIGKLLDAPMQRRAMGQAGLARFEEHFSAAVSARRFADLYRSLA
jgi:glycosyltransferase involved in cell wall biosynthesis